MLNGRLTTGQFIYASPKSRLLSDLTPSLPCTTPSHDVAKVDNVKKSIAVVNPLVPVNILVTIQCRGTFADWLMAVAVTTDIRCLGLGRGMLD